MMRFTPILSFVLLSACLETPSADDAASVDAQADAGDAGTEPISCEQSSDCDDGLFCNGVERCAPLADGADPRGCAPPLTLPCASGERCDEPSDTCRPEDCDGIDQDGDSLASVACDGLDCDDGDADRYPGNTEACDAADPRHDEDCDPCTIGADADSDLDSFPSSLCGNPFVAAPSCDPARTRVEGTQVIGTDCDDANPDVHPGQPEECNTIDDDCDGATDEGVTTRYYADVDMDGYGAGTPGEACTAPPGMVSNALDCDDTTGARSPIAVERCDGFDEDCDGTIDDGAGTTVYRDADGDAHGDASMSMPIAGCTAPAGFVVSPSDDCDDATASIHPGAIDPCNGVDDDCSLGAGLAGGADLTEDGDGDRHAPIGASCAPGGFPADDCDDAVSTTYAGAAEICNTLDDDCDGASDGALAAEFCGASASCTSGGCVSTGGLAAGARHNCALRPDESVVCWGEDDVNQLGDGPPALDFWYDYRSQPGAVSGLAGIVELAANGNTTCARRRNGTIACWGAFGGPRPTDVAGATEVVEVEVLANGPCVRTARGAVLCANGSSSVAPVVGLSDVYELAAGARHACARLRNGSVWCWGANDRGQLGDGTTIDSTVPVEVSGLSGTVQLAVGSAHSCARESSGRVLCWGGSANGQLGDGTTMDRLAPALVPGLADASDVVASGSHTCARRADASVWCWGANASGEIGDGTIVDRPSPVAVAGVAGSIALAAGTAHTCARLATGEVACWGDNTGGQLGDGNVLSALASPHDVEGVEGALEVSVSDQHTCARLSSGGVSCWGLDGTSAAVPRPHSIASITDAVEVVAAASFSCVRHAAGSISCWGANDRGQLGDGTNTARDFPAPVSGIAAATRVAAGQQQACAILSDRRVVCWGAARTTPVEIGIDDATALSVGWGQACALRASGEVACWGSGYGGQLGDGNGSLYSDVPVTVVGLPAVTDIGTGPYMSFAIVAGGAIWAWGDGTFGNLMVDPADYYFAPVESLVTSNARAVNGGCVLDVSGEVRCCGNGLLSGGMGVGDGTLLARIAPVPVLGVTDAIDVSGEGGGPACAVRANGRVACWGRNEAGQLGTGAYGADRTLPFRVPGLP